MGHSSRFKTANTGPRYCSTMGLDPRDKERSYLLTLDSAARHSLASHPAAQPECTVASFRRHRRCRQYLDCVEAVPQSRALHLEEVSQAWTSTNDFATRWRAATVFHCERGNGTAKSAGNSSRSSIAESVFFTVASMRCIASQQNTCVMSR